MTRTRVRIVTATLLLLLAVGCTGDDDPELPDPGREPVALELTTVSGGADLDGRTRAAAEDGIGDVLSSYVVGGFLGDYPRRGFVRAFDTFSEGLVARAGPDLAVITGSRFADADSVRAVRLDARISLATRDDRVFGASAAVLFDFEATLPDGSTEPFGLRGRILLMREGTTWTLFGYDVAREDGQRVEAEAS